MSAYQQAKTISFALLFFLGAFSGFAQIDPEHRNLVELGYDQPLAGQGPQGIYAYYYYNQPDFYGTNIALRVAFAPTYLDSELGFKQLISPTTDLGIGIAGGAYGDNYYEVRQGTFIKRESFDGDGGSAAVNIYQLLDPGKLIPLSVVARGGIHYATYDNENQTAGNFVLPRDQLSMFTRVGLRFAGNEPVLYPELGLEVSLWFEQDLRFDHQRYGFNDDRSLKPSVNLYWAYAGLNYTFTNIGHQFSVAITAGGSDNADRLSAWRLGGVLPLIAEYPLVLPGYYYEELTAQKFVHFYGAYEIPLDRSEYFRFRVEGASAVIQYLPGFEQNAWQSGVGCGLAFTPKSKKFKIILRYGYGFNAIRNGSEGAQSIGVLFQYDFMAKKKQS
jgi:hypothetical protein